MTLPVSIRALTLLLALAFCGPVPLYGAGSEPTSATDDTRTSAVRALVAEFGPRLLGARYMEHDCRDTTYPGWEGYPLKRCRYKVTDRDGKAKFAEVIMLNPSPEQIARWIVDACETVTSDVRPDDTRKLFQHVIAQSGGQFPVAGVVYEDIIPADGQYEVYCFRHGVTVKVAGVDHRTTTPLTAMQIEDSIHGKVTQVFTYARIQSTTPGQYTRNGGTLDVGTDNTRTLGWLDAVRQLYQAAWGRDRNELMIAWARDNLGHRAAPRAQ